MLTQEQVAETRKANLDLLFDLGNKTVEGVGKLAALYMQTIRATLADTLDLAQKSLSVKEPQDWSGYRTAWLCRSQTRRRSTAVRQLTSCRPRRPDSRRLERHNVKRTVAR